MSRMHSIRYLAYQFAKRYRIYRTATTKRALAPESLMTVSFLVIFAAFAACQALLTVKFADFLSPPSETGHAAAEPRREVGKAKLA